MAKFRTAGAILSAAATAGALFVDGIGIAPNVPWQWIALASFVLFVVLVGWRIWELEQVNKGLHDARPDIRVESQKNSRNEMYLEVQNQGADAEFEAQIEVLPDSNDSMLHGKRLIGFWQYANGGKARIKQGLADRLLIATRESAPAGLIGYNYNLHYYDPQTAVANFLHSHTWVFVEGEQLPHVTLLLRITISSAPSGVGGPTRRLYLLRGSNPLKDVTGSPTPLAPDMATSQPTPTS